VTGRVEQNGRTQVTDLEDDPERRFRAWPRGLRRWTATTLWRRVRLPVRRRRWHRRNAADVARYLKSPAPRREGPVVAIGDFSGATGLSRAARYELDRLRGEHAELTVIDIGAPEARGALAEGTAIGTLYILSAPDMYSRLLALLPPESMSDAYRIGLWVWETPIFPTDWSFALDVVHEIWTPSDYSRLGLEQGCAGVPVRLRPHHVTPAREIAPFDRSAHGIPKDAFLGLAIMDICSCPARKNPWAHIAAWKAAFGAAEDRVLVLKIRVSKRTRPVLDELREMISGQRNILILEAELTGAEIAGLQRASDVYLSLHRAEGYGLNIRECLELGVPVIATNYSANAEYGPAYANYHPLPWRPTPYRDWTGHYPDGGFTWAEVQIRAARDALLRVAGTWVARRADAPLPHAVRETAKATA